MAEPIPYPLGGYNRDYNSRLARTDALNCHLEPNIDGSFVRVRRVPGLSTEYDVGLGPIRGMFEIQSELFVVSRNKLFKIDAADVITELGDVGGSTSRVYMDANGADDNQIFINSDGVGFIYDVTAGPPFQQITDPEFLAGIGVASLNQIFWVPRPDSNTLQGSDTANGFAWDALRRVSAEQDPDLLVQPVTITSALWLMGKKTCEIWQTDISDATNPIRPIAGATIQRGVGADESIAKFQNNIFWLADDFTVWQISGNAAEPISDLNIEYAIRGDGRSTPYTAPEKAQGFFIDHPVNKLYVLTFPADGVTWTYNVRTKLWSRRASKGIGRWRGMESALFNNKVLVGDYRLGKIWELTEQVFTEDGDQLKCQLVPPAIINDASDMTVESIELFMEVGVGDISNIGSFGIPKNEPITPLMQFEFSKDGGISWKNKEDASLGAIGQTDIRVKRRIFGRVRRNYPLMVRFTITDAVSVEMYKLLVETDS